MHSIMLSLMIGYSHSLNIYCIMKLIEVVKASIKRIRLHDLSHNHASLLVELGFTPLLIAELLDNEKMETTLNTYCNLYPNKQNKVVDDLENLK